jgi:hypothetical protein
VAFPAVVFAAAVFVLRAAVAQDVQLAVPPASEQERVRDVPLAAHSVASLGDPQDALSVLGELLAVHLAAQLAVRLDVSPDDPLVGPQVDCLAVRWADDHC